MPSLAEMDEYQLQRELDSELRKEAQAKREAANAMRRAAEIRRLLLKSYQEPE